MLIFTLINSLNCLAGAGRRGGKKGGKKKASVSRRQREGGRGFFGRARMKGRKKRVKEREECEGR